MTPINWDTWYKIRGLFQGIYFYEDKGPFHVHRATRYLWYSDGSVVNEREIVDMWNSPIEDMPLYINTVYAPLAKKRLEDANI